jgi:hypothetical protein
MADPDVLHRKIASYRKRLAEGVGSDEASFILTEIASAEEALRRLLVEKKPDEDNGNSHVRSSREKGIQDPCA